jgi:hypothetical protein
VSGGQKKVDYAKETDVRTLDRRIVALGVPHEAMAHRHRPYDFRRVSAILHAAQRDTQIALGRRDALAALRGGAHRLLPPWGEALEARLRPELRDEGAWEAYRQQFTSFVAEVRGEYSGNADEEWAARPLYWIRVRPVDQNALPTTGPPSSEYHISLLHYAPNRRALLRELESRYGEPHVVTLRGNMRGAMFELDPEADPIASDPLIQQANETGRQLHISM